VEAEVVRHVCTEVFRVSLPVHHSHTHLSGYRRYIMVLTYSVANQNTKKLDVKILVF